MPSLSTYPSFTYRDQKCVLVPSKYVEGERLALQVYDAATGSPVAVATVNIPQEPLSEDECFIKDWSENDGIFDALVAAGFIEDTGRTVPTGFVEARVARVKFDFTPFLTVESFG